MPMSTITSSRSNVSSISLKSRWLLLVSVMVCLCSTNTSSNKCSLLVLVAAAAGAGGTAPIRPQQQQANADHVSMTKEAALLRAKHLDKKKPLMLNRKKHKPTHGNHHDNNYNSNGNNNGNNIDHDYQQYDPSNDSMAGSFTSLLFPGSTPEVYHHSDRIPIFVEYVESRKTQLPVKYFQMPGVCRAPSPNESNAIDVKIKRKNLGQRLMGTQSTQLTSYSISALQDKSCTPMCQSRLDSKQIKFLKKLVDKQYRVHFTMDSLPVLVRSKSRNYALRGFPIGFKQQQQQQQGDIQNGQVAQGNSSTDTGTTTKNAKNQYYIYNHLRFVIYYNDFIPPPNAKTDTDTDAGTRIVKKGMHITGFDVVPVSIQQDMQHCNDAQTSLQNKIDTFQPLKTDNAGNPIDVLFSYEVSFQHSDITWADRWDIYMT